MNNQQLVDKALALRKQTTAVHPTAAADGALLQRLPATAQLNAYLLARQPDPNALAHANLVALVKQVAHAFDDSELRALCFELALPYDDLPGAHKSEKARELVLALQRRSRLADLLDLLRRQRPRTDWGPAPARSDDHDIVSTLDIAVVVDIARPSVRDVARYLDEQETTANIMRLQHAQTKFLSAASPWDDFVRGFADIMNSVKHTFSGARVHFFLSAPGALLFGLGAIWGTVDEAIVYHYEANDYHPVLTIARGLRSSS